MKLQKVKPESRPLNNTEKTKALTTSTAIHFLIRQMDYLSQTTMYSSRVKQTGNLFLKALENYSDKNLWQQEVEGSDINSATEQIESMSSLISTLFTISLGLGYIDPEKIKLFHYDLGALMERHDLPITIDENGDLSLRTIQLDEA